MSVKKTEKKSATLANDKPADAPGYLSPRQLATRWAISVSAVYMNRCETKRLPRYRFGRAVRFRLVDIIALENEITNRSNTFSGSEETKRRKN